MTFTEYLCQKHNLDINLEFELYKIEDPKPDLKEILFNIANELGFNHSEIIGRSRKSEIVANRHIIAHLLYKSQQYSFCEVGLILGGRDHSSICHAKSRLENHEELGKDELIARFYDKYLTNYNLIYGKEFKPKM
jgi:chromosomal replication initiation ATPase DnaA